MVDTGDVTRFEESRRSKYEFGRRQRVDATKIAYMEVLF